MPPSPTASRARRRSVAALARTAALTAAVSIAGCTSDGGPAESSLDTDAALAQLEATCNSTAAALDALAEPVEPAERPRWTGEVAAILRAESATIGGLTLLDADQRQAFRAFADNTAAQADAWEQLGDLLETGADLSADPRIGELTTEIAELSLGRDELSDELDVAACRRA